MSFLQVCYDGDLDKVKLLIKKGITIDALYFTGDTALHIATKERNTKLIKLLLEKGGDVDVKDKYEYTPLMHACGRGYIEVVKILLDAGANINFISSGNTPLSLACDSKHKEIVNLLLDNGADIPLSAQTYILKKYCIPKAKKRSKLLKEELIAKYYSPENIEKWSMAYGKDFDEVQEIM